MATTPFVAEIMLFAGNFVPKGWAACDGQLLPISANTALFSLLGTTYGGNGTSNFGLPNLQGRTMIGAGQSQTGSIFDLGQIGGTENITLTPSQIPYHAHDVKYTPLSLPAGGAANTSSPVDGMLGTATGVNVYGTDQNSNTMPVVSNLMLDTTGQNAAINNLQPGVTVMCCIAMQGVFPARG
ncbi:phage tail protein [Chitinophaga sp. Hz27]|uniref:phage tail protein n=1 Tax=Chitinophaga sp. Hz27 TaxID=3347169 RepID=UPI0035E26206